MNGHKILVLGNHDHFSPDIYLKVGFEKAIKGPIYWKDGDGKVILSHIPVAEALSNRFVINIHGHLHGMILNLPNYFNVSAKNIDYKPVNAKYFVKYYTNCTRRNQEFLYEWYAPYYKVLENRDDLVLNDDNTINLEASILKRSKELR